MTTERLQSGAMAYWKDVGISNEGCMKTVDPARSRWQIHLACTADCPWDTRAPHRRALWETQDIWVGCACAEMAVNGSRWGWLRQNWSITTPFLNRWSGWEILHGASTYPLGSRKGAGHDSCAPPSPFPFPGAYNDGMVVMSWEESIFVQHWLGGGSSTVIPLYLLL